MTARLSQATLGLLVLTILFVLTTLGVAPPTRATTVRPMDLSELSERAGLVVQGRVIDLRVLRKGAPVPAVETSRPSRAPVSEPTSPPSRADRAPRSAGALPGLRIVTRVTLEVERTFAGQASETVAFEIAGGTVPEGRWVVHGMPRFELGQRVVLFLHADRGKRADPVVGLHQGFFEVVPGPDGEDALLDSAGNWVIGIEDGRIVRRFNPARSPAPTHRLVDPPKPAPGSRGRTRISPEVGRYWLSEEAPLSPSALAAVVSGSEEVR